MSSINSFASHIKNNKLLYIVLAIIDFAIAFDYTRGGVIYATDSTIFVYNYPLVSYRYLLMAIYSYYPWYTGAPTFSIFSFLINILPFLFSLVPFLSDTLFLFTLIYIGNIFIYMLIYKLLRNNLSLINKSVIYVSSLIGAIFYAINPQILVDSTFTDIGIGTYVYILLPALFYGIREIFTSNNLKEFITWYLIIIPIALIEYYFVIPIYTLIFVITLFILLGYYSFIAIRSKKYIRILLVFIPITLFILINIHSLLSIYNETVSQGFLKVSYLYWVNNAKEMPLFETLRGLILVIRLPAYAYFLSFGIALIYLSPLILNNRKRQINSEILLYIVLFLVVSFLYSMPNVPFSNFLKTLFFKFPILSDLRTQYVIVGPFESLVISIVVGLGSYYIIDKLSIKGKKFSIMVIILILLSIVGTTSNVLFFGLNQYTSFPNSVNVPEGFINTVNYINLHSSINSAVWILPISATENAEKWYQGQNLFNLFLKNRVILGGGYYSYNKEERTIIDIAETIIGKSNFTKDSLLYLYNFFYLFNIHYIILEKDYNYNAYPIEICFAITQLYDGLNNLSKLGIIKLVFNNSLYSVYSTNIKSSFAFISYENLSENLTKILFIDNLTKPLFIGNLTQINPTEYIININPSYINKTAFIYIMLPYSSNINVNGASIINKSVFLGGYTLLELHINSAKLVIIYSNYSHNLIHGIYTLTLEILLPILLTTLIKPIGSKLKKLKLPKIIFKYF
ncbi:hypothetical protein [Saccharolobus islandicus]|uniref:hypothetical protein n=1 Tax=Saccharolobus islandicus TaxID=43080 RepID=UPI00126722F8|nr:hypothetical protein [Sulfolobus islandicus]